MLIRLMKTNSVASLTVHSEQNTDADKALLPCLYQHKKIMTAHKIF